MDHSFKQAVTNCSVTEISSRIDPLFAFQSYFSVWYMYWIMDREWIWIAKMSVWNTMSRHFSSLALSPQQAAPGGSFFGGASTRTWQLYKMPSRGLEYWPHVQRAQQLAQKPSQDVQCNFNVDILDWCTIFFCIILLQYSLSLRTSVRCSMGKFSTLQCCLLSLKPQTGFYP